MNGRPPPSLPPVRTFVEWRGHVHNIFSFFIHESPLARMQISMGKLKFDMYIIQYTGPRKRVRPPGLCVATQWVRRHIIRPLVHNQY